MISFIFIVVNYATQIHPNHFNHPDAKGHIIFNIKTDNNMKVNVYKISRVASEEQVNHWLTEESGISPDNPVKLSSMFHAYFGDDNLVSVDDNGDACLGLFHRAEICLKSTFCLKPSITTIRLPLLWGGDYVIDVFEHTSSADCIYSEQTIFDAPEYDGQSRNIFQAHNLISASSFPLTVDFADEVSYWWAQSQGVSKSERSWSKMMTNAFLSAPLNGQILEFGVASGRSLAFLAQLASQIPEWYNETLVGFDSFQGLPVPWGRYDAKLFDMGGIPPPVLFNYNNIDLKFGYFNETLQTVDRSRPISFLHIDSDLYESALEVLEGVACLLAPGTIIVFDEFFNLQGTYGKDNVSWWRTGEYRALQEISQKFQIKWEPLGYYFEQAVPVRIVEIHDNENCRDNSEIDRTAAEFSEQTRALEALEKFAAHYGKPQRFEDKRQGFDYLRNLVSRAL